MKENYLKIALLVLAVVVIIQAYFLYDMNKVAYKNSDSIELAGYFPKIAEINSISSDRDFFKEMERLRRDMEKSFMNLENFIHITPSLNNFHSMFHRTPRFDMKEKKDKYVITVEVPGSNKDSIETKIENGRLSISAKVSEEKEDKTTTYYRHERRISSFKRNIILPSDIDEKSLHREYKNGLLIITLSKKKP